MTPEHTPIDPALERAVSEIREETIDPAAIEAAAARVWAKLAREAGQLNGPVAARPAEHIRSCADFQALIPEFRAGRLRAARAALLEDHLHQCVACRHVFEGKVVPLPAPRVARRGYEARWAVAAVVVAAAGLSIWFAVDRYGMGTGHAIVRTVNGSLWEVSAAGLRPLAAGQDLPDGIEIRTAKDSSATLALRDGSEVELRERSGFSTSQSARDTTVHLARGSVIVQAAKRSSGHLYVDTADCRVAVTGTVFSVSAGAKGSRVSVIQGEVHVSQYNRETVLHPGDQAVTNPSLEPVSVREDISWSRNRDRLLKQLDDLRATLQQLHLPGRRYASTLIGRLPASTVFFASIPNLAQYLAEAQDVFRQKMMESPELRAWSEGRGFNVQPVIEKLRAASEYLGDEIVIAGFKGADGRPRGPVFLAETKRAGFPEFLKKEGAPLAVETRGNLVAFGPERDALAMVIEAPSGGFAGTPFYARIAESYHDGAGLLLCADLSQMGMAPAPLLGARYFIAEQKEVGSQMVASASVSFAGARTGIAAWLADPSPMGALDYVSPEATVAAAFVVKTAVPIVDQAAALIHSASRGNEQGSSDAGRQAIDDLAGSLGGEFALAVDGPIMPVPSLKLVVEVYDPARFQATVQKLVATYNRDAANSEHKPLRMSQESVDGHTYYMVATGDMNPLTEFHYTFADGYLIEGPTRALVSRALQLKTAGTSIKHSARFLELTPPDHHLNFSAVIYQNLGTTLAPLTGLLGAFVPSRPGQPNPLSAMGNMKSTLIAAYGEPDRITVATDGNVLGASLSNIMSGNVLGMTGIPLPFAQMQGTHAPRMPYR
ncbi:MAG: FecR family protein [Acidobacteriia bacterium]|nr:FecR family protein [Terriglobia bacterium]